ncbi:putative auxin-responsive protein IAA13-like [Capsicum annuum]|nr:putative auxin-responsive protein IAA13-like [Capsicum annuum]
MRRLSTLKVGSPRIRSLPLSLTGLSHLFLYGCEVLESIPDTIQNLRILEIILRNKLATLPNSLFESEQLELVNMYHNSRSVELFVSVGSSKEASNVKLIQI